MTPHDYSPVLLDHFYHPRNAGPLDRPDGLGRAGDPGCGDSMEISIQVAHDHIVRIGFRCRGCAAAIACGSMTTHLALGKHLDDAGQISDEAVEAAVGGLRPEKRHCSNLAASALYEAILDYVVRSTGLPDDHLHSS